MLIGVEVLVPLQAFLVVLVSYSCLQLVSAGMRLRRLGGCISRHLVSGHDFGLYFTNVSAPNICV